MDYLITEGYPSAAEKFASEANIRPRADFSCIQERVQIRDSIHRGDLQAAIEFINELNPELLDTDKKLHFSLLRLQLVELIRQSFASSDATLVGRAIEFAQNNLAPYAPLEQQFKNDLERAMALLIVPKDSWTKAASSSSSGQSTSQVQADFGALAELVDPSLRRKVAKDVNEAILQSQDQRREANIRYLVRARAWAEGLAREKKVDLPEFLSLGLDADAHPKDSHNGHHGDTEMTENGAEDGAGGGDADLARYTNITS
ncbi:CTLH/CRA C-terminal to lish motif domain-containing protein [Exophiala viscosa]|uniref:Protein FYV10 n=1 Tax=Exophiala viscosa TaxID=2486360 RepID=A0AAN6DYT0_9EURO|nr:CTLH/CRA C-terminal to lish motif domain-containing protein [Exophiala viscosa]KAI1623985.1 CTLH/CRA C-terminal to lish motif domain-containing protein [Exophiala viscosa]